MLVAKRWGHKQVGKFVFVFTVSLNQISPVRGREPKTTSPKMLKCSAAG